MSTRLSRSEREFIIGSYLKGKPVAGYDVIECANGKYRVKAKPFEVEEDEPGTQRFRLLGDGPFHGKPTSRGTRLCLDCE